MTILVCYAKPVPVSPSLDHTFVWCPNPPTGRDPLFRCMSSLEQNPDQPNVVPVAESADIAMAYEIADGYRDSTIIMPDRAGVFEGLNGTCVAAANRFLRAAYSIIPPQKTPQNRPHGYNAAVNLYGHYGKDEARYWRDLYTPSAEKFGRNRVMNEAEGYFAKIAEVHEKYSIASLELKIQEFVALAKYVIPDIDAEGVADAQRTYLNAREPHIAAAKGSLSSEIKKQIDSLHAQFRQTFLDRYGPENFTLVMGNRPEADWDAYLSYTSVIE